jgi:hypothetical protein
MTTLVKQTLIVFMMLWAWGSLAAQEAEDTIATSASTTASTPSKKIGMAGYLKGLPSWQYDNHSEEGSFGFILHNRLNFKYQHNTNLCIVAEVRNRYIAGGLVGDLHEIVREMLEADSGLLDMSVVPLSGKGGLWHLHADRLYADWKHGAWQVRLGRQRINWGINMVSNPNDLFNNYSFFDFDYEERPGADALRITRYTGATSRAELAVNPARKAKESVAAALWGFNRKGYDIQLIGGYFRHKAALGAGWAGNIRGTGFKGEVTLFSPMEQPDSLTLVCAIGFDHMFGNGVYTFAEILYNGGHTSSTDLLMLNEPMRADNLFISKYAATFNVMYPISPVLAASFAVMVMPDISASYLMPTLTWSAVRNFDLGMVLQYFRFNDFAGVGNLNQISCYVQGKWSF